MIDWPGPTIQVIGLGVEHPPLLGANARQALAQAEILIGSQRHLASLPPTGAQRLLYPSPLAELDTLLQRHADKRIVLLASGDPLFYGIGGWLKRHISTQHLVFHPAVSSIQAAFARIGQPWQQAEVLSLHGRPLASLRSILGVNRLYALLTDAHSTPQAVAQVLIDAGFESSDLWLVEDLGSSRERIRHCKALDLKVQDCSPLNVILLQTRGHGGVLPEFPGIPDSHFSTDGETAGTGMISKREVRLSILSLLSPYAGQLGWDLGAGCGGVSVEWARWNRQVQVYAVEYHPQRLTHLEHNRQRFGVVNNLQIVPGQAPQICHDLPDPNAIFIGGSDGALTLLLDYAWQRLSRGGRLVASAVTEDSRMQLYRFADELSAQWCQISVARGETLASQRLLRPHLPVLLMQVEKP